MKANTHQNINVNESENNPIIIECTEKRTEYVEKN